MTIKNFKSEGLKHEFVIQIPSSEVQKHIDLKLKEAGRGIKIPGFRPGKAPLSIIKQRYGDSAREDALWQVAQESLNKVIKDKKFKPVARPEIDLSSYQEGQDLDCFIKLEVMPEIQIPDFSKLKLTKLIAEATDEDTKKAHEGLVHTFATHEEVKDPRPIQEGDLITFDVRSFMNGEEVKEEALQDRKAMLKADNLPNTMFKNFLGKKVGDVVSIEETSTKDNSDGKKRSYECTITKVETTVLPVLDDAFVKDIGYKDLAHLDKDTKERLQALYDEDSFMYAKRQILDQLATMAQFDIPQTLVDKEFQSIWSNLLQERKKEGKEKFSPNEEKNLKDEYLSIAARRIRLGLLLAEVAQHNKIEISQKEVYQSLEKIARQFPGQEKKIIDIYLKSPDMMASLRAPLIEDSALRYILTQASVTDKKVSAQELKKEVDKIIDRDHA